MSRSARTQARSGKAMLEDSGMHTTYTYADFAPAKHPDGWTPLFNRYLIAARQLEWTVEENWVSGGICRLYKPRALLIPKRKQIEEAAFYFREGSGYEFKYEWNAAVPQPVFVIGKEYPYGGDPYTVDSIKKTLEWLAERKTREAQYKRNS